MEGVELTAQILREEKGWIARAQVKGLPFKETVARFSIIRASGEGKWQAEAPLTHAYGDWWTAEVLLAPPEDNVEDAYIIVALLPRETNPSL